MAVFAHDVEHTQHHQPVYAIDCDRTGPRDELVEALAGERLRIVWAEAADEADADDHKRAAHHVTNSQRLAKEGVRNHDVRHDT